MCGIAGFVASDLAAVPEGIGLHMRAAIGYRGRDGEGAWSDGTHVALFHARLSIIDLETGQQPMLDAGGRYAIVYNGEIYNYRELRAAYQACGGRFRTRSDTEVILEGFRLKGPEVCRDLNGMFAFALWDREARQLVLARDHLGKKPLVWCLLDGVFYFASTLDAFQALPGWTGRLSKAAIAQYAALGSFPDDATVYEQARALPYASYGVVRPGAADLRPRRYWRMAFAPKATAGEGDLLAEYEEILTDAVRIRLRSDVPLALTFSGGVDSGTIAAVCARRLEATLACYTIDYHTADDPSEETINAERAARHLGLDWRYIHFDYHHDLLAGLGEAYRDYDQPCQQLALVYSRRLYDAIKPFAKVVLTGNGADELFTGYDGDEKLRRDDAILTALRGLRPLFRAAGRAVSPYLRLPVPGAFAESLLQGVVGAGGVAADGVEAAVRRLADEAAACGVGSRLDLTMFLALTCGAADTNYRLPDVSGLAAQVEVRSPYLDHRMVEFAARLPHRYKVARLSSPAGNKYLPKRYCERFLPADLAWGRKKGMGWNLRWDVSIATDPGFRDAFAKAFAALDDAGIGSTPFRRAWDRYTADRLAGRPASPHAGTMMNGFMLGMWLARDRSPRPAGSAR